MATPKRNWPAVKAAYIAGATAEDLERKHGIPAATIKSKASRDDWGKKRKEVATKVQLDLPDAIAGEVVDQAASVARQNLDDLDLFRKELVGLLPAVREKGGVLGPTTWVDAYRKLMDAQRLAQGQPTTNDQPKTLPQKGGPDASNSPEANPNALPGAVLILPGKSTDWAELAVARASGLDTEPG